MKFGTNQPAGSRVTLLAILLCLAAGAIFAIAPAAFAQNALYDGPSGDWSGYYNHGGWSGYYNHGGFVGTIPPQGPDATIVQGTRVVEQSGEENGHWIFLSAFAFLALFRLTLLGKFLQSLKEIRSRSQA
jgi:hypothetical protein